MSFTTVKPAPAPLFAEFRRGAIFALAAPGDFNSALFEAAVEKEVSARVMISAANINLNWETNRGNGADWRELKLPMLGWEIVYARRGDQLILANSSELLREIQTARKSETGEKFDSPSSKFTVLNFSQKENAYDRVFAALAERHAANGFFTGNVGSLLDSLSAVEKIESSENYSRNFLVQEIIIKITQPNKKD